MSVHRAALGLVIAIFAVVYLTFLIRAAGFVLQAFEHADQGLILLFSIGHLLELVGFGLVMAFILASYRYRRTG